MGTSRNTGTAVALVIFFGLVTVLTAAGFLAKTWLPPVASEHGGQVDRVIVYLLVTTGIIFVVGHAALGWLVWRHSRSNAGGYRPVSARTEFLWALVPVALMAVISEVGVLVMGLPVFQALYGQSSEPVEEVEVVGKQFEWIIRYPGKDGKFGRTEPKLVHETRNPLGLVEDDPAATDDVIVRNVLRMPADRTLLVRLRSLDVQHAFTVPAFRIKQDLVPGLTTQSRFKPTQVGEYEIACAELCGLGHYKMKGIALVLTQENYRAWLAGQVGWFE